MNHGKKRHIALEGGSNFRDLGGYKTVDGQQIKWGRIYRSGALWRLTDDDWRQIADCGIVTVCDLRSDEERELSPTLWRGGAATRHVGQPYTADLLFGTLAAHLPTGVGELDKRLYASFPELLAASLREVFARLLADDAPVLIHCSAGQDRTGFAVALLLTALGVPPETIIEDYLLSTTLRRPENEMNRSAIESAEDTNTVARFYKDAVRREGNGVMGPRRLQDIDGSPFVTHALAAIDRRWGSLAAFNEEALNIDDDGLRRLRDLYLEPAD